MWARCGALRRQLLEHEEVAGVDINLGCPAPVVCSKQAGGGLLRDLEQVNRLLGGLREECGEQMVYGEDAGGLCE